MRRHLRILVWLLPAGRLDGTAVVNVALPPPSELTQPIELRVGSKASLELAFPYPVADWVGRGFTPDPSKFKGDFAIETTRGQSRVYLRALATGERALLHLSLVGPKGVVLSYPFEVAAAPDSLAWSQITFTASPPPPPRESTSFTMPTRDSTPERECALLDLTRLLGDLPKEAAQKAAEDSRIVWCATPGGKPETFGGFSIELLRIVQDRLTADLAFEASVSNETTERLWLDPFSWVLRNGERVYPVRTLDFTGTLEPRATVRIAGVIAAGPVGVPPYVDLGSLTLLSARLAARTSPRPVHVYELPRFPRP